jgi:hypothetical protein
MDAFEGFQTRLLKNYVGKSKIGSKKKYLKHRYIFSKEVFKLFIG